MPTSFDTAIEATFTQLRAVVTFSGSLSGSPVVQNVTDVRIERQVTDIPDSVTEVFGSASAQATITLAATAPDGTDALDISPYSGATASSASLADYGLGAGVTIAERITDASGSTSDFTLFTGVVSQFAPQTDGTVIVTALDYADKMHCPVALPAAASTASFANIDAVGIVDLAMRAANLCASPTTRAGAVLSVPSIGAALPEVGNYVQNGNGTTLAVPTSWGLGSLVVTCKSTWKANCASSPFASSQWTWHEAWYHPSSLSGGVKLMTIGAEASSPLVITALSTGAVQISGGGPSSASTATAYFPNDGAWHYVLVGLPPNGSASSATITVDAQTPQTLSWPAGATLNADMAYAVQAAPDLALPTLGSQIWNAGSSVTSNAGWTSTGTPPSSLDSTPIYAINQTSIQDAWQLIQDLAKGVGAVCYFDELGAMQYKTRSVWRSKRLNASVRTINSSRLTQINYHWSTASIAQLVTSNVSSWKVTSSLPSAAIWSATDTYTCPASSTQSYDVSIDSLVLFALQPTFNGFDTGSLNSWFRVVKQTDVDNGGATPVTTGVTVTLTPTGTGLTLTIKNSNGFAVALWTPGDGGSIGPGPYLVVHGLVATGQPTRMITSSARSTGSTVALDDSPWRQDVATAQSAADDIAHDLAMPVIVFDQLTIPVDPRLHLGDVVTLQDTRSMATGQPVQIIGIVHNLLANGQHTSDLTVRACYPPTGWVLGVTGRSELGTTTTLVI